MAMKAISDGKQVLLVCNENIPELTNAKNFLYNNLKNKGYCETMGITEDTPLSRMVQLLNSFIPYAEPHLYIYNQGYLNTMLIGGEEFKSLINGSMGSYYIPYYIYYEEDYIEVKTVPQGNYSGNLCYLSHIKIPTSQYNTLKMEYQMLNTSESSSYISIKSLNTSADTTNDIKSVTLTASYNSPAIVTMDISDIDYDTYLAYRLYSRKTISTTVRIYRIWMEK